MISLKDTELITVRDLILENGGALTARIEGGRHNLFAGCTFRNGLGKGIDIRGGRYNADIVRSRYPIPAYLQQN